MSEEVRRNQILPSPKGWRLAKHGAKPRRSVYFTLPRSVYLWAITFYGVFFISCVFFATAGVEPEMESGIFVRFDSSIVAARNYIHFRSSWWDKPVKILEIDVALTSTSRLAEGLESEMPQLTFLYDPDTVSFEGFGNLLEEEQRSNRGRYYEWAVLTIDKDALEFMSYDELVSICDLVRQKADWVLSITTAQ